MADYGDHTLYKSVLAFEEKSGSILSDDIDFYSFPEDFYL